MDTVLYQVSNTMVVLDDPIVEKLINSISIYCQLWVLPLITKYENVLGFI